MNAYEKRERGVPGQRREANAHPASGAAKRLTSGMTAERNAEDRLLAVCDDIIEFGELDKSGAPAMHRDLVEAVSVFRALKRSPVLSGTAPASAENGTCDPSF